jgi:hypothetical protein
VSTYRGLSQLLALLTAVLGLVIIVSTLRHGVGVGVILGLLFVAAGAGRLYLMRRRH